MIHLAVIQPEIAGNVGTLMRLVACLDMSLHVVGPLGFVWSDKHLWRAGMDYAHKGSWVRHTAWSEYIQQDCFQNGRGRTIATVPGTGTPYAQFSFRPHDHIVIGKESTGLDPAHMGQCDHVVHIPMQDGARSLNMAIAGAIVGSEALRQVQKCVPHPLTVSKITHGLPIQCS